jgi:hypothetical protein
LGGFTTQVSANKEYFSSANLWDIKYQLLPELKNLIEIHEKISINFFLSPKIRSKSLRDKEQVVEV